MVANHYRWDFVGLSTDTKPTPQTSEKVVNGSTYYCSDTSKLYVFCDTEWYERKPLGGGGGGTSDFEDLSNRPKYNNQVMTGSTNIPQVPTVNDATLTITQNGVSKGTFTSNDADDTTIEVTDTTYSNFTGTDGTTAGAAGLVPAPATTDAGKFLKADGTWDTAGGGSGPTVVQTTGTSTTDVMSQNAVTSMIYADPGTTQKVSIGGSIDSSSAYGTLVGYQASIPEGVTRAVAIGYRAGAGAPGSVAIGTGSSTSHTGEVNIGSLASTAYGYNNSNYRLLSGLYDGQSAHDAVNLGQLNSRILGSLTTAPTTSTVGVVGSLIATVESGTGHLYICTDDTGGTYTWSQLV